MRWRASCREGDQVRPGTLAHLTAWAPARMAARRRARKGECDGLSGGGPPTCGPMVAGWVGLKPRADGRGRTRVLGQARLAPRALVWVLGRVAAQGWRLSAGRWADPHAVAEPLGRGRGDDDDRSAAWEARAPRQAPSAATRSRV